MTSSYLEQPIRSQSEVLRGIIGTCAETYLIVDMTRRGEPYVREGDIGQSFRQVVRDLADGQYDFPKFINGHPTKTTFEAPLAVIRVSLRDNEAEDVTEKVAEAVLQHLVATNDPRPCPFLDEVMPDWRQRSGLAEEAA